MYHAMACLTVPKLSYSEVSQAKNFMLYFRLIYMLSILCVRLMIKVKVGIPESFKVGWYPLKKTGSSHLNIISH